MTDLHTTLGIDLAFAGAVDRGTCLNQKRPIQPDQAMTPETRLSKPSPQVRVGCLCVSRMDLRSVDILEVFVQGTVERRQGPLRMPLRCDGLRYRSNMLQLLGVPCKIMDELRVSGSEGALDDATMARMPGGAIAYSDLVELTNALKRTTSELRAVIENQRMSTVTLFEGEVPIPDHAR
jgi:hypothetical protein